MTLLETFVTTLTSANKPCTFLIGQLIFISLGFYVLFALIGSYPMTFMRGKPFELSCVQWLSPSVDVGILLKVRQNRLLEKMKTLFTLAFLLCISVGK